MKKLIAVLLVAVMALALAACGDKTPTEVVSDVAESVSNKVDDAVEAVSNAVEEVSLALDDTPMSYADYIAAPIQTPVLVETYIQAKQSWWDGKATLYTQSPDGAYFIYELPCTEEEYNDQLVIGSKLIVAGYKAEWNGEIEISDVKSWKVDADDNFEAAATDVTDLLGTDQLIDHQNEKVAFTEMTVEASKDADGNEVPFLYKYDGSGTDGDDLYFKVSKDGQTYTFTVESYLTGAGTDVYEAVKALKVGDTINMQGFMYWYEGPNPHITEVTAA